jgi:ElaB/YqjD/DUF883 family membrane-anchored ribosome-binding protein
MNHPSPALASNSLGEKSERLKEQVGQSATLAKDIACDGLKTVQQKAADLYHAGSDKAVALKDGTLAFVRENPVKTVLLAVGIGAVAGLLLARRR